MTISGPAKGDSEPFITIAIPTFNRASWVEECVRAALAQSYSNFEVLVLNNASTDGTAEILRTYHDPRLRVVTQKSNVGLIANWNACLAEAKGTYIVLVPDDDLIAPCLLERSVSLLRSEPDIPIVVALSDIYLTAEGRTLPAAANRRLGTGVWNGTDILREFLRRRLSIQMCSIMMRVEALRARGGFPFDFPHAADMAIWAPLLLFGRAGLVNESCATFRLHDESQTSKFSIDICLNDNKKIVDMVIAMTDEGDRGSHQIQLEAQRYFAGRAIEIMAGYRKAGGQFRNLLPVIWRWRRDLRHVGIGNTTRLARPLAILLLPRPLTGWVHRLRRSWA